MPRIDMGEFLTLRGDLDQQALAKVMGTHAGGIEVLHQVEAPPDQFQCPGVLGGGAVLGTVFVRCLVHQRGEHRGHLLFASGKVAIIVKVTDDELRGLGKLGFQGQGSQLPRQVIGEGRRLG